MFLHAESARVSLIWLHAQLFNSTSYLDDLMLAAAWLGRATGAPAFTAQAEVYWGRIYDDSDGTSWQGIISNWDNSWWVPATSAPQMCRAAAVRCVYHQTEARACAWDQVGWK